MKGPWKIETMCLGLRPFVEDDTHEMVQMFQNDAFVQSVQQTFSNKEAREALIEQWVQHGCYAPWAVVMKASEELVGICSFSISQNSDGTQSLTTIYIIDAPSWEQGYAHEAARAARDYIDQKIMNFVQDKQPKYSRYCLSGSITKQYLGVSILELSFTLL